MSKKTDTKKIEKPEKDKSVAQSDESRCCYVVNTCGCYVDPCCCTPSYACCC